MFKDRLTLALNTACLVALQLALWPLILKAKSLPAEVPLWYTQPTFNRLAPVSFLWIIPAVALAGWLINLCLGWWLYRRYPAITQTLAALSVVLCLMAAIAIMKTVLIYTTLL